MNRKSNNDMNLIPLSTLISLRNRRALITGSASGIGKAIAYRFAEAGANLELIDINLESLTVVKEELQQFDVEICLTKVDLSKKEEIDSLWENLKGKEPDILVNNAGVFWPKSFLEVDQSFLNTTIEINLNSVFWMCQHMIRSRMKKGGVIINMGSVEAIIPFKEGFCHYDISKAGIMAFSRALAKEHGKHGFRINVLVPGGIWTPGTKNLAKDIAKFKLGILKSGIEYSLRTPLGRLGKSDEIARMTLVLASDLSSYVHGALIVVDGGFLSS